MATLNTPGVLQEPHFRTGNGTMTSWELNSGIEPACDGTCFDFVIPETAVEPSNARGPPLVDVSYDLPELALDDQQTSKRLYSQLAQWQTRLLRLHPRKHNRSADVRIDLFVVNLLDADGVTTGESSGVIQYEALSYTWGSEAATQVVLCNGLPLPVTTNLAAALTALQPPIGQERYLWVDAICINQNDGEEKADQVAKMLRIYQKATSVTVWLGESGVYGDVAFACIENHAPIAMKLICGATRHSTPCQDRLAKLHTALSSIYGRPWLRRTWVRQEVYAARSLTVQCGLSLVSWDAFVSGAALLDKTKLSALVDPTISMLLADFAESARAPPHLNPAYKPRRDLVSLLLSSKYYGVTNESDTVYALLGMAGVPITSQGGMQSNALARTKGIVIDYSKTVAQVYQDTTTMLIGRAGDTLGLMANFYFNQRASSPTTHLPSWVMDWRSSRCSDTELPTMTQMWRSPSRDWKTSHSTFSDDPDHWPWPGVSDTDARVLEANCQVLNYVAYLTNYSCDLEKFFTIAHRKIVGPAANNIHLKSVWGRLDRLFPEYLFTEQPKELHTFEPTKDTRRCVILGVSPRTWALALVPANARKGDLIVAIAPGTLPLLLRSVRGDSDRQGLYTATDWYESREFPGYSWTRSQILGGWVIVVAYRLISTFSPVVSLLLFAIATNGFDLLRVVHVPRLLGVKLAIASGVSCGLFGLISVYCWLWYLHGKGPSRGSREYRVLQDQLDEVCERLGPDFEFQGPVFVRQHNPDGGEARAEMRGMRWNHNDWHKNNLHDLKLHKLRLH